MSHAVRKVISTAAAAAAVGAYSQAVVVDKTIYVSGQLGLLPGAGGDFVSKDVGEQTKQALSNMGHILEAAGSSMSKVVKCTILLADINDFSTVNTVYSTFFSAPYPARAAYQVSNLPKGGRVEIEAIAIVGDVKDL